MTGTTAGGEGPLRITVYRPRHSKGGGYEVSPCPGCNWEANLYRVGARGPILCGDRLMEEIMAGTYTVSKPGAMMTGRRFRKMRETDNRGDG